MCRISLDGIGLYAIIEVCVGLHTFVHDGSTRDRFLWKFESTTWFDVCVHGYTLYRAYFVERLRRPVSDCVGSRIFA